MKLGRGEAIRGFDFHCHLDLQADPIATISQCERDRIITLAVTTTPRAWPQNTRWAKASAYILTAPGLHPELVGERAHEIGLLEHQIGKSRVVGEIGLDGSPQYQAFWTKQIEVFRRALRCAQSHGGRIASIHSRRAAAETVGQIQEHTSPDQTLCILHWYSGSIKVATEASEFGCYFSINHRMLASDRGRALARSLPLNRLLTETDSPFTSQVGRVSRPVDVVSTVETLARVRGMKPHVIEDYIRESAREVLSFCGFSV